MVREKGDGDSIDIDIVMGWTTGILRPVVRPGIWCMFPIRADER